MESEVLHEMGRGLMLHDVEKDKRMRGLGTGVMTMDPTNDLIHSPVTDRHTEQIRWYKMNRSTSTLPSK